MSTLPELYGRALDQFGTRVHQVASGQWDAPTPCTDWAVDDLVRHLVLEQMWVPFLLAGGTTSEGRHRFSADRIGDDPVAAWDDASAGARDAFAADGALDTTVHLSYGASGADAYCREMIADLLTHGWDLARGIGGDDRLDPVLLERVYTWTAPHAEELAATGLFAAPVPVAPDADLQTRTLAMFGRDAS